MKFRYLAIAILPFALVACQSSDLPKSGHTPMKIVKQSDDKTLATYQWSLETAGVPKPILLDFSQDSHFSISTSCNTMASTWKNDNQTISIGNLMSSLMACPENYMKQEGFAAKLFSDRKAPFVINLNDTYAPTLTIKDSNGQDVVFTGKMKPEYKYNSAGETIFLEVSPETKQCTGVTKQTCLQVREIKYAKNGVKTQVDKDWTLFYDQIEGFTHTPDERQVIRVKRFELKNPAADQSKYAYVYDMAIERESVKGSL